MIAAVGGMQAGETDIPIARFHLRRHSVKTEAGKERKANCLIEVAASGEAVSSAVLRLERSTVR